MIIPWNVGQNTAKNIIATAACLNGNHIISHAVINTGGINVIAFVIGIATSLALPNHPTINPKTVPKTTASKNPQNNNCKESKTISLIYDLSVLNT